MKRFRAGSILDINETFVIYFQKRIVNFKPMDITEYATPRQVLHSVNFVKQTYLGDSHFPAKLEEKCKKKYLFAKNILQKWQSRSRTVFNQRALIPTLPNALLWRNVYQNHKIY